MAASNTRERPRIVTVAAGLLCITLIGVILAWAKTVLIPIALAIFLTFILSPLVTRLDRWGLGRVPAVLVVVVAVGIFLAGLFGIVGSQLYSLANDLPNYQANIRDKIAALRASGEGGAVEKVRTTIEGAARATESESEEEPTGFDVTGLLPVLNEPVPVRVVPDEEEEAGAALDSFVASLTTFRPAPPCRCWRRRAWPLCWSSSCSSRAKTCATGWSALRPKETSPPPPRPSTTRAIAWRATSSPS